MIFKLRYRYCKNNLKILCPHYKALKKWPHKRHELLEIDIREKLKQFFFFCSGCIMQANAPTIFLFR